MASNPPSTPSRRVREIAAKLEQHIRTCGLSPGDRYITTAKASQLLGTSVVTAQRAMNLLAQRKILERRPKAGTFIGPGVQIDVQTTHIHFFLPEEAQYDTRTHSRHGQMEGLRSVLGHLSVHFHFVPRQSLFYIEQMVKKAAGADLLNGAVLSLSSREIRAFFNRSGIPTVVEGGVDADLGNLCWIQYDQHLTGELLTRWLIERGHRRFATIMRDIWTIGDDLLHDGIQKTLTAANLPSDALRVRSAPLEKCAILELAHTLLLREDGPTGFICRNEFQADCVAEAARALNKERQIDITHCNTPSIPATNRYTCTVANTSFFEFGQQMGRMFATLIDNQTPSERGIILPVILKTVDSSLGKEP